MRKICSIDGCNKPIVAHNYCDMHYRRYKRGSCINSPESGPTPIDHTGKRFGMWVALFRAPNKGTRTAWLCKCDCGTEKEVITCHLVSGKSASCGCNKIAMHSERLKTHGLSETDEYKIWLLMRSRCNNKTNPSYKDYGGRGIKICDRWNDFLSFYIDMGQRPTKRHSIGRIDNDGNYCPDNCRWETPKQQANNTRRNRYIEINGTKKSLTQVCDDLGLNYGTVKWRLLNGKSISEALK